MIIMNSKELSPSRRGVNPPDRAQPGKQKKNTRSGKVVREIILVKKKV